MVKLILWSLLSVICIDLSINYLVELPKNNLPSSSLSQYFDYGRSIESKIFRLVGKDDSEAASISKVLWFTPLVDDNKPKIKENHKKRVVIYGMSFSNHIGKIIAELDQTLDVKMFAGPSAPLNHSYNYYQQHRPHNKGDIVILGILASSVPKINSLSHMTANFESPLPHFYPRYHFDSKNNLVKKQIKVNSLSELRKIMNNESSWNYIKKTLEKEDSYYDSVLFLSNFTDKSIYTKLLKRAWGQKHASMVLQQYHDKNGYKNTDRLIDLSGALVLNFAKQVRSDGAIPFVVLFNDRGFNDHLFSMLQPVLDEKNIPFYSTHNEFPATTLTNFITDGHFTPEIDRIIAASVLKEITKISSSSYSYKSGSGGGRETKK
ncbi:MAG: hypothetical protein L3J59_08170 [Methylococcaceae bacterium]|nr:hypothetical protein [Methylococcaceae bacterium]